jgi:hypothetical protein
MTRTSTIVTLALLSSVLTPVVVKATGTDKSAPAQQAKVEMAAVTTPVAAAEPACARKVKVVYAGYGEAHAAACATTADLRR